MNRKTVTLTTLLVLSGFGLEAVSQSQPKKEKRVYEGCLDAKYCAAATETCVNDFCSGQLSIFAISEQTRPYTIDTSYSGKGIYNVRVRQKFKTPGYFVRKPAPKTLRFIREGLSKLRRPDNLHYKGPVTP